MMSLPIKLSESHNMLRWDHLADVFDRPAQDPMAAENTADVPADAADLADLLAPGVPADDTEDADVAAGLDTCCSCMCA